MRKWKENEEMENQGMERDSLSTFPHLLLTFLSTMSYVYQKLSMLSLTVKYGTFIY